MKVREFFRLTKGKVILMIILTLVIIYIAFLNQVCPSGLPIECSEGYEFYTPPGGCTSCMTNNQVILNKISTMFVPLIFSYLISCLIILIINKIRRRR